MQLETIDDWRYSICLVCILLLAFALRIAVTSAFVGFTSPPDLGAQPDQQYYETIAYNLAIGRGYTASTDNTSPTAIVVPGTSLTLLPIYLLFGHSYSIGRLWLCFLSALTCLGIGLTVQQIWNRTAALAAATLMAIYPNHFYYSMHFVSETPYMAYMAGALACTVTALRKRSITCSVLGGFFWGAAVLTRAQILLIIPLGLMSILLNRHSKCVWKFVRVCTIQIIIIMAMLLPWLVRNMIVIGKPVLSTYAGHTLWISHNELIFNDPTYKEYRGSWLQDFDKLVELYPLEGNTLLERDQMAKKYALQSIRQNLGKMPMLEWQKFIHFINPLHKTPNLPVKIGFAAGWSFIVLFSLAGIWFLWRQERQMGVVLLLPILATLTTSLLFHAEARYRDSASPAFVALAAIGATHFALIGMAKLRKRSPTNGSPSPTLDKSGVW